MNGDKLTARDLQLRNPWRMLANPGTLFALSCAGLTLALLLSGEKGIEEPSAGSLGRSLGSLRPVSEGMTAIKEVQGEVSVPSFPRLPDRFLASRVSNPVGVRFTDATLASGLEFEHFQRGKMLSGVSDLVGSGACVSDFDGDGYLDIYVVNGSGFAHRYGKRWWWSQNSRNALFRNVGNGTFEEVAEKAGVSDPSWGMGCAFGDFDNDGNPDLYVSNYGKNLLYRNNGNGTFADVTDQAGVGDDGWGTSVNWADYDRDGLLDLYVVNYIHFDKTMSPAEANSAHKIFKPLLMNSGLFEPQESVLYRNAGDGTFSDVTASSGVADAAGRGLGAISFDYDNDGDLDIYVVNDRSRNVLFSNEGDWNFMDLGGQLGVDSPMNGMGVTVGDYDNDGDLDIFSTYDQSETNILYENRLENALENDRELPVSFADRTVEAGLGEDVSVGHFGWSSEFVDFDNDGYLDIFVANGHGMVDFDNPQATIGQRNQIFRNNGSAEFSDVSREAGEAFLALGSSRGMVSGDFDNDGDVDFFVVNNNGKGQLIESINSTGNHWINIELIGTKSNRDGIGARLRLTSNDRTQIREARSGSGYLSQIDQRLAIGLGKSDLIDEIEVSWPSGLVQKFEKIEANTFVKIIEGEAELEIDGRFPDSPVRQAAEFHSIEQKDESLPSNRNTDTHVREVEQSAYIVSALQRLPAMDVIELAMRLLDHGNPVVRREAIKALARAGQAQAVPALLKLLERPESSGLHTEILEALGSFSSPAILDPLLAGLNGKDHESRRAAARSLGKLFEPEERIFKFSVLKKRETVSSLIKALNDSDDELRALAASGLGLSESYRAVVPIAAALQDSSVKVRRNVAQAAGTLRDRRATAPLLVMLQNADEDDLARIQALFALRRLEGDVGLNTLLSIADSGPPENRKSGVRVTLKALKDTQSVQLKKSLVIPFAQHWIGDADPDIRRVAVEIAGVLKTRDLEPVLAIGMQDPIADIRIAAVQAAGESRQSRFLNDVTGLISDDVSQVRRQAWLSLSRFPADRQDGANLLRRLDHEDNPSVRNAAFSTLMRISSASAVPILETELRTATGTHKLELLKILGMTDDAAAKVRLLSYLNDQSDTDAQVSAASALRKHGKDAEVFLALLTVLKDRDRALEVRQMVLSTLVDLNKVVGTDHLFPHFALILKVKSDPLRGEVIRKLGAMDEARSADLIASILQDTEESPFIRNSAFVALTSLDPKFIVSTIEKVDPDSGSEDEQIRSNYSVPAQTFINDRFVLLNGDCSLDHGFNRQSQGEPTRRHGADNSCAPSGNRVSDSDYPSRGLSNFRVRVQSN